MEKIPFEDFVFIVQKHLEEKPTPTYMSAKYGDVLRSIAQTLPDGAYIAGGALTRLFVDGGHAENNRDQSDIDIWMSGPIEDQIIQCLKETPPPGYEHIVQTESDGSEGEFHTKALPNDSQLPVLEIIGDHILSIGDQLKRFDFTCCQLALARLEDGKLWVFAMPNTIVHILERKLVVNEFQKDHFPHRIQKYEKKGFVFQGERPSSEDDIPW